MKVRLKPVIPTSMHYKLLTKSLNCIDMPFSLLAGTSFLFQGENESQCLIFFYASI